MKDESKIIDWRSTGRRKARRTLYLNYVEFKCVGYVRPDGSIYECGNTQINPPKDAPAWFDEIWPSDLRVLPDRSLQADHETKDVTQNDLEHLNWRCASCHKFQDQQTGRGIATVVEFDLFGNPVNTQLEDLVENIRRNLGLVNSESEEEQSLWG